MSINHKFWKHHSEHPEVFEAFCSYARQARARGYQHYSGQAIIELARWHSGVSGHDGKDPFKLNNDYVSRYVRMFEFLYPSFVGFFRKRGIVEDFDPAEFLSQYRVASQ